MIILNKIGYLEYKNFKFKCAFGKRGIGKKKKEGDKITLHEINKNFAWCDDPLSKKYNQLIKLPTKYRHEKLYRKDNIYDLILVLTYNMKPIIKNKGSAIFIHVARKNYESTAGCIALKKADLIILTKKIKKNTKIII